jgi:hypothetical protein
LDEPEAHPGSESRALSGSRVAETSTPIESDPASSGAHTSTTPGRLHVRGIDADTGAPLDRIRVRAMSDTRFADRSSDRDGEAVELTLTPDTYSVLVLAKGYEASELPPQHIVSGETTSQESVPMHSGSARVLGSVTGDTWPTDTLWVELTGEGRRPCAACAESAKPAEPQQPQHRERKPLDDCCEQCGYSARYSRLVVPPNGRFVFARLVSGPYALRLIDARERTVDEPMFFALNAAEVLPVEIRFSALRTVFVQVIDVDGVSLAPEWAARLRAQAEDTSDVVEFVDDGSGPVEFQCAFRSGDVDVGHSTLTAPRPNGTKIGVAAFGARKLGAGAHKHRDRDDRLRGEQDELRPTVPPVNVTPASFPCEVESSGFARFDEVPSSELSMVMTCGSFTATTEIPASRQELRLQAMLHRTATEKAGAEGASTAPTFRAFELQGAR